MQWYEKTIIPSEMLWSKSNIKIMWRSVVLEKKLLYVSTVDAIVHKQKLN